jgi:fructoselysine-6-P-deglycase FrlB-like protein
MATSVWPDFKHRNPKDPLEPIRGHHGGRVETAGCGSSLFICAAQTVYAAARSIDMMVLTRDFISQHKPRRQFRDCLPMMAQRGTSSERILNSNHVAHVSRSVCSS